MAKKVVVITGVTHGLGRAMAEEFMRLGHRTFGCGRSRAEIKALNKMAYDPDSFSVVDITSDKSVREWSSQLLLNNAGVINRSAKLWEVSAEEFDRVIHVNVCGTANVLRQFSPSMIQKRKGVIVNFSSGWGRSTDPMVAPYCASKWAIEGMTQAFAQEVPSGIAVVALNPGVINTDMLQKCFGSSANQYPSPAAWARKAVPFLLKLGSSDNGKALDSPA